MKKITNFLIKNGYKEDSEKGTGYKSFHKDGLSSIDVCADEIVFIGEEGDWLHIPLNYYALIGALVHYRQLSFSYCA